MVREKGEGGGASDACILTSTSAPLTGVPVPASMTWPTTTAERGVAWGIPGSCPCDKIPAASAGTSVQQEAVIKAER
jgi:hypothetical protein